MTRALLASAALLSLTVAAQADEQEFPAVLAGQAILPALSTVAAPADAPAFLQHEGKFSTPDRKRAETVGSVPGKDGIRLTGIGLPLDGQALQGFSGIRMLGDGSFWILTDNGLGNKLNSTDSMLKLNRMKADWATGKVERLETIFFQDPDKVAPFPIQMEGAEKRYLTGSDFDLESVQPVADGFWIGEELGPYLLHFTRDGKLTDVIPTLADGKPVMSPDNPVLMLPGTPGGKLPAYNLKRSNGFEGMAQSPDGSRLYALLEGPLYLEDGSVEKADGHPALRVLEFDVAAKAWTGRSWFYPFHEKGVSIGDFNMLDAGTGLVIERDGGTGSADKACADPKAPTADCFPQPATFKRVYKIAFGDDTVGKAVRKVAYIDLMNIKDPAGKALQGASGGVYTMPFVTIENVDRVDADHIIVVNDNNLPFSAGRSIDKADDNEFNLIEAGAFLSAK